MVFKIKNWDDSWDYVDKVDSVRFYPPGSFELFMKENSDGNFAPALRVVDTKSHIPHDIKDDFLRITTGVHPGVMHYCMRFAGKYRPIYLFDTFCESQRKTSPQTRS